MFAADHAELTPAPAAAATNNTLNCKLHLAAETNMYCFLLPAARRCASAPEINAGIVSKTAAVASMGWPAALTACGTNTYAVFVAQRCGNEFNLLEYKAIYAINAATKQIKKVKGRECSLFPQQTDKTRWFGSCGVVPKAVSELPNMFCNSFQNCAGGVTSRAEPAAAAAAAITAESAAMEAAEGATDASIDGATSAAAAAAVAPEQTATSATYRERVTLKRPLRCGNSTTATLTLIGSPCGPGRAFVQWTRANGPGCSFARDTTRAAYKNTLALLGSCGAGPALSDKMVPSDVCSGGDPDPPKPSPRPSNPIDSWAPVTRMSVAAGEDVPRGVAMVEAVTSGGACPGPKCVADVSEVAGVRRVVVGVADSGVDETHPDINYVGGTTWLGEEDQPGVDGFGHGECKMGLGLVKVEERKGLGFCRRPQLASVAVSTAQCGLLCLLHYASVTCVSACVDAPLVVLLVAVSTAPYCCLGLQHI
jgi:hypothetical protein